MKKFFAVALILFLFTTGMFTSCSDDRDSGISPLLKADKEVVSVDSDTVNFELRAVVLDKENHGKPALIDKVIWHMVTSDKKDRVVGHQESFAMETAKLKQTFSMVGQCAVYSEVSGHFGDQTFDKVSDKVVVSVVYSDYNIPKPRVNTREDTVFIKGM